GRGAGHEEVLAAAGDLVRYGQDLLGGLAGAEDDLREASSQGPVVIDLGEAKVLVGQALQAFRGLLGRHTPVPDRLHQRAEVPGIHVVVKVAPPLTNGEPTIDYRVC